ncbi:citramalyl-CoA lyase, mitochondrial [Lingula anatina]|uniref:Citramalyl-CoA lyase, mitochondrial n=1 Tax=Lingula anatina TaxID=7574 RepID=A0A1S3H4G8_LINAN|nr:citramalyl-CoA lyase, mitochondrial [Lingula anatina]|eukprot:XP_013381030.1 citramalyl-CoA lyase, mitochondrial [Lingula anatina]
MSALSLALKSTCKCPMVFAQRIAVPCHRQKVNRRFAHQQKYVPRRAMLYVPGDSEKKIHKISTLDVDCAVMDCEDGVALNKKKEARETIASVLSEGKYDFGRTERGVRCNQVTSGFAEDDFKVLFGAKVVPDLLLVPKVDTVDEMEWIADKLKVYLGERQMGAPLNLIFQIESAIGLINLHQIILKGLEKSEDGVFHLTGIMFGSDDFCANIGASRTLDAYELTYVRQKIVVHAKAYNLQAIDMVQINFKDLNALREQSLQGSRMGFTGKQVIHPNQVAVVQTAFSPSEEQIQWATEMIEAFNEHQKSGKGAFVFRGVMIDMPSVLQARNIVQLVQELDLIPPKQI